MSDKMKAPNIPTISLNDINPPETTDTVVLSSDWFYKSTRSILLDTNDVQANTMRHERS